MTGFRQIRPAALWRAFFVLVAAPGSVFAAAPTATPPPLAQVGKPSAAEAADILDQFQRSGLFGYFEFELHALPRRDEEIVYRGRMWGGRNNQGAVSRVELTDGEGRVRRLLLQNGAQAAIWRFADGRVAPLGNEEMFEPLLPGVEITAFDLLMPYLYWPGATVESVARVRGRPAHVFVFRPPAAFAARHPEIATIRAYFDTQFGKPVQIDFWNATQVVKSLAVVDLKKIGEQWILKSFDVRNELTRDKSRFQIVGAALDAEFAPTVFESAALATAVAPPAAAKIVPVAP